MSEPAWIEIGLTVVAMCGSAIGAAFMVSWILSNKINTGFEKIRSEIHAQREGLAKRIDQLANEANDKRDDMRKDFERKLESARIEGDRKVESAERAFGETVAAIREKVVEVQNLLIGDFVRKSELREILKDAVQPLAQIEKRLIGIEAAVMGQGLPLRGRVD